MTHPPRGALVATPLVLVGALVLGACGETFVDTAATTPPSTVATTLPPVAADAPLDELLAELDGLMRGLDERIVEEEGHVATLARIDEVWGAAEAQIRERDPDDLFPFEQAIALARTGVERRRPADASKGHRILITAIAQYDTSA